MTKAEAALFFSYQSRLQKHPFNDQQRVGCLLVEAHSTSFVAETASF
jgi:hypothetical protein